MINYLFAFNLHKTVELTKNLPRIPPCHERDQVFSQDKTKTKTFDVFFGNI